MAKSGNVIPLRLTISTATRRIHIAARKSGAIVLGHELRATMADMGILHPQLAEFLVAARVIEEPELLGDLAAEGWRCRIGGPIAAAGRGVVATVVLLGEKVYVEDIRWV